MAMARRAKSHGKRGEGTGVGTPEALGKNEGGYPQGHRVTCRPSI